MEKILLNENNILVYRNQSVKFPTMISLLTFRIVVTLFMLSNIDYASSLSSASSFCAGLPAGQYCSNDLKGYYNCGDGFSVAGGLYKCGLNERCSCQFKKKCVVPRREICQKYLKPLPIARNFMLSGFAEESSTTADGKVTTKNIHGTIFSNADSGKFRLEHWFGTSGEPNTYRFEYLFRNINGKYTRVSYYDYL